MNGKADRLYALLPRRHRYLDAQQGGPLKALLRVIAEQVGVVEADITQLYENWFVETCQDWVVPYIGDLVGYQPAQGAGAFGDPIAAEVRKRHKILIPRRDVADTIRNRRRKGTLALLEELAADAAGWPARAVEFYKLLDWQQAMKHLRLDYGRSVDLRQGDALHELDSPFDKLAHLVDVRRISSKHTIGRYNIPGVGLFVWRLKVYPLSHTPARCLEGAREHCFTFSALGNDAPLFTLPEPEEKPTSIATYLNLPIPIRRQDLEAHKEDYYGPGKSLQIWAGKPLQLVPADQIFVANLSDWEYRPPGDKVAVDPELGRIVFDAYDPPEGAKVSYHYGFSADMGGGEYRRTLANPPNALLYRVGADQEIQNLDEAIAQWVVDNPDHATIEITDSGEYLVRGGDAALHDPSHPPVHIELREHQSLQLRAANRTRPLIRLLDYRTDSPDALRVSGQAGSRFMLDGLLVSGRGLRLQGELGEAHIRHSTLVPGWTLDDDHGLQKTMVPGVAEPSLLLYRTPVRVTITHSILGSIQVNQSEVSAEPNRIHISDSILDATGGELEAVGAPTWPLAHASLTVVRSTVIGEVETHAIELAENSLFMGRITAGRRQMGCMRFCYVTPNSHTPRRYNCQPDLVEKPIWTEFEKGKISEDKRDRALERERLRVRPQFNSTEYGAPTYCQLAHACAEEIKRGADDESEMGVFHDLFQPQRDATLRARLDEYTPAGMEAGIIYVS